MASFLDEVVQNKREEVAARKRSIPLDVLSADLRPAGGAFLRALEGDGIRLIAEVKPASPSAGVLSRRLDVGGIVGCYERYACAISVLADSKYFDGSLELVERVATVSSLPVLCKEFVIDQYQIYEARRAGAQAVLLIVKILSPDVLASLHQAALSLGLTPVVEVQNEGELEEALALPDLQVVMINNRDLSTLSIDLGTTERLAQAVPLTVLTVSASGVEARSDIDRLAPYCSRFLVGSALMRSPDPEAKLKELVGA